MQKKVINEYESTKKMLNTLRSYKTASQQSLIREQVGPTGPSQEQRNSDPGSSIFLQDEPTQIDPHLKINDNITVINNVDVKINSTDQADMNLTDAQKSAISTMIDNFKSQVSQIVSFEPGLSINESQIRLDGVLTDNDVKFVFISGQDGGLYINAEMLKIDNTVIPLLDKLIKFEDTFKTTFEPFINQRQTN